MERTPRIAFIVLAHRFPRLLHRAIDRLNCEDCRFFVHVDAKSDIAPFRAELESLDTPVFWVKREDGRWGGFGIVQATLNGMEAVLDSGLQFDHVVLLSGQTYPIKSKQFIAQFFRQNAGVSFLHYHGIPDPDWSHTNGGLDRIERYHFIFRGWPRTYPAIEPPSTFRAKILQLLFKIRFPKQRRFPNGLIPYGGSQWWCLTQDLVEYVVEFCRNHKDYVKYHKHTLLADEIFFHSIILNAELQDIRAIIKNEFSVHMDWSMGFCKTLTVEDFNSLSMSDRLFARKFDEGVSDDVLNAIDISLLGHSFSDQTI